MTGAETASEKEGAWLGRAAAAAAGEELVLAEPDAMVSGAVATETEEAAEKERSWVWSVAAAAAGGGQWR